MDLTQETEHVSLLISAILKAGHNPAQHTHRGIENVKDLLCPCHSPSLSRCRGQSWGTEILPEALQ